MMTAFYSTLLLIFLLIILPIGAFFFYLYWWSIQRSNPQHDGELTMAGLQAPVEVLRDKHGVPHLYAQSRADLLRAQGFVHAQDRLWQMEQNRRIARGALAEVYGEAALDADRFSRIIGFWRAAQAEAATLDETTRQHLTWYAEGVNAYIDQRSRRLGAEFNLLRVQPAPWDVVDTLAHLKVMGWGLSLNWESELTRLRLLQQLDPVVAGELEPNYPAKSPLIMEGVGSTEAMRLQHTAGLLLNQYESLKQWLGVATAGQGSNAWVLGPKNSLNRRALLCNDPHMAVQIPGAWYEVHLTAPDFEVSGASWPGVPGVIIGHNADIAWGMTNAMVDVQDLYLLRAHPEAADQFEYNGAWETATVLEEIIAVRRRPAHAERVVITRHGPLISGLIASEEGKAAAHTAVPLALQWTGHAPGQTMRAILQLNQARDWQEFETALTDWVVPVQNVVFADSRGNIGYVMAGQVPHREQNLGLVPAPGWDEAYAWRNNLPAAALPRLYNPPSGKIVTANNKLVGDDYPYFLGVEFDPGWRAARIEDLLQRKERHTIRDMEEMQLDNQSKLAEAFTPWLTLINSEDPWEKTALQALRKWNFRMDADNFAATVYQHMVIRLLDLVFGDKLTPAAKRGYYGISSTPLFLGHGFALRAETRLLEILNEYDQSFWYVDAATGRHRDRETLLQEALSSALRQIRSTMGDSTRHWDWGRAHQVRYVHPLGSARLLKNIFNRGPVPVGGDSTTPNLTRHAPELPLGLIQVAANYRQIYEVGSWDRAQTLTNSGQSGHPLHPHYDDQIMLWREGVYHKMPWSREAVEGVAEQRLVLKPTG